MISYLKLKVTEKNNHSPESLKAYEQLLVSAVLLVPFSKARFKLKYFKAFLHFLEIISVYLVEKNHLVDDLREGIPATQPDRIMQSFLTMLCHYNIVHIENGNYKLNASYHKLSESEFRYICNLVDGSTQEPTQLAAFLRKRIKNFQLVSNLIKIYRNPSDSSQKISSRESWMKLILNHELDYEIRLAETLSHLSQLQLPNKIRSPLDESYYTESGRNAFQNFTRLRFLDCLNKINIDKKITRTLDIGCGYGNYIEAVNSNFPKVKIWGIEMQENVYRDTLERFTTNSNVSIFNKNIFDFKTDERFDLVLLNYVLFYFNNKQKEKLFEQLHDWLDNDGTILVCQYYAGIEELKHQLMKLQGDSTTNKRIANFFGNKILYANALWNETSDAFVQSEIWDEFLEILNKTGFEVAAITNADPFYYSLFIRIRKSPLN